MLPAPGNTDNGNAEQQAEKKVGKRYPNTAYQDPDDVENSGQATCLPRHFPYLPPERQQCKQAYLKTLQAKWNTNNGETKQQAAHHILHKGDESAENKPDDVTY